MPTVALPSGPVLVVHGTAGAATPVERARALAEAVPDCRRLLLVEGGTHAAELSDLREVDDALLALVRGL